MEPGIVTNTFNPSTVQRQVDLQPAVPSETLSPPPKKSEHKWAGEMLLWLKVQTTPTGKGPRLSSQHTYEAAQNSVIAAPGDPTPSFRLLGHLYSPALTLHKLHTHIHIIKI